MKIRINNKDFDCKKGEVVLDVALRNGIKIPAVCRHTDLEPQNSCRLCLVEIKGKGLQTSCSTKVENGMEISTESAEIKRLRKINLELLFSQHIEQCSECNWSYKCKLLELARKYEIKITKFNDRKKDFPTYQFGPSVVFDSSKCIDCKNCIAMCQKQGVGFLDNKEKDGFFCTVPGQTKECVYCGQCITHCPSGAFEEVSSIKEVEEALKKGNVVFQFAPAIRSSIGEEFNLPHGSITTGKLVAALRKLGAKKVFDVSFSADITTIEEGGELIERLSEDKNLPMFTSCCPSWVRYVEVYKPELIKHLTSVRSPHIILGGLIKMSEDNPIVVSIMPCVSKKYEITREELKIDGVKPVDYVLTTRELGRMIRKNKIDFEKLEERDPDYPWGEATGAGVIYGATGGVMESALRTVYEKITGKSLGDINLKSVRGLKGVKEAEIKIGKRKVRVAVINGLGNIDGLDYKKYDYIEVMACPGGCIGGGGQPIPIDDEIRKKRAESLYIIDKKKKIRLAHESPFVEKAYREHLKNKKIIHKICHTTYGNNKNK
ncbi:MAG: [FeFe] hydrogenase, group A [Candidatus Pacebacteria bacterium]|nr:[FeFe] hydrogenase, group A [Candidatus Paceibacterota bacterium]MDD2757029.1 [FeFe] hydrogenase, group A [Candidatus Paceibacterota bacterium]MDD3283538.1 [FeFe] hydrogenase, group A [Candidatus Paceibacterota bacterium]MDD4737849.1 [FeFe] hydrogenase, group A [Candidatus Paceibacterota bacterium]